MYSVYILKSEKNKRTYIGFSKDINKRLFEHNFGKVNATKHYRPWNIIFIEKVKGLNEAKKREKYWKSGGGRRRLKKFFDKGFPPITL